MKDLLEAGVHFGHQTKRWNPKMKSFIFTKRKGIHIIDLQKTVKSSETAYEFVKEQTSQGKTVLFVGTKKQAQEEVKKAAEKCEMPYIILRWLGGMLTNFVTVRTSITRLKKIESILEDEDKGNLTKRELLSLEREKTKLNNVFSGIKEMNKIPDIVFIVDTEKENIAIRESKHLKLPIVGVVDTNGDPTDIDYPIPGNDDAIRAINLFTNLIAEAVIEGKKILQMKKEGEDQAAAAKTPEGETDAPKAEILKEKYSAYDMDDDDNKIRSFEKLEQSDKTEVLKPATDQIGDLKKFTKKPQDESGDGKALKEKKEGSSKDGQGEVKEKKEITKEKEKGSKKEREVVKEVKKITKKEKEPSGEKKEATSYKEDKKKTGEEKKEAATDKKK